MKIKQIFSREILDSRGNPTIETTVCLSNGIKAKAAVPSGASTGKHEAIELRDNNKKRYNGKGVLKAIKNVEQIIFPELKGLKVTDQVRIDNTMIKLDGTDNKANLGANAILSVSLACARAGALATKKPLYKYLRENYHLPEEKYRLPIATMNILNGGRHATNGLSCQEFMIIPKHRYFKDRVRIGAEVFHQLKTILKKQKLNTGVGDEGGFAPELDNNEQAIKLIIQAIKKAGYKPGKNVFLGFDLAASEFYKKSKYYFEKDKVLSAAELTSVLAEWLKKYPILSIEDPLAEDDWTNWQSLTKTLGKKVTIVGDDLFVTNVERLAYGIENKIGNAILIKLNQIGTLTETIEAIYLAKDNKYKVSISHRSGETADTFIADLAVAVNADFIKTGSLSRSERVEKYNRLMAIEQELFF